MSSITKSSVDPAALTAIAELLNGRRGVIVAGRGCGIAPAVRALALAAGWPVLADARSGVRHLGDVSISAADALLRSAEFAAAHRPEVVVRLGEPPVSKVLNQWLATSTGQHLHVTAVPTWTDPDGVVTSRVVADPSTVCVALAENFAANRAGNLAATDASWLADWLQAETAAQAAIDETLSGTLSEPATAQAVVGSRSAGSHLVVSSSMPIRDVEWYGIVPDGVIVHCNRGANGIDGVIATATGVALATGAPTTLLIGDIAFLHDSSALTGLAARAVDLRIVLIDNDGGGIFSFLPQASALPTQRFEQLFGTPHGVDLVGLATAHGLRAAVVDSIDSLLRATAVRGPSVTVVHTDRTANVSVHAAIHDAVCAALASR